MVRGNEPFAIEARGFDHIPEAERNMTLRQVDHLWLGTSVNLFSFALGSLALGAVPDLWWALAACVVGNLTYAYLATGSVFAVRAGLPVSTLARASFGMRGNLSNAFFTWIASLAFEVLNTIFSAEALLASFQALGWSDHGAIAKCAAVLVQLLLCGGIAVLGHATVVWMQRLLAWPVAAVLLGAIGTALGKVEWTRLPAPHALSGMAVAGFLTACAIVASNPLSFLCNGPDWVRYLPAATPAKPLFAHILGSSYLPSLLLTIMGALCATLGNMTDPVAGLKPFMPHWLFIAFIAAVVGGSIANTVPTFYSSGLALQALGIKLRRYAATALDILLATAVTLYILFVQDFSTALTNFVALLIVWVGPFGGIWICDAWLRRGLFDPVALHTPLRNHGRYWGWHGFQPAGCIGVAAGMLAGILTTNSPLFEGPVARALGGADCSWIVGFPVAALVYFHLRRGTRREMRLR